MIDRATMTCIEEALTTCEPGRRGLLLPKSRRGKSNRVVSRVCQAFSYYGSFIHKSSLGLEGGDGSTVIDFLFAFFGAQRTRRLEEDLCDNA
jgi:hypothetical protein